MAIPQTSTSTSTSTPMSKIVSHPPFPPTPRPTIPAPPKKKQGKFDRNRNAPSPTLPPARIRSSLPFRALQNYRNVRDYFIRFDRCISRQPTVVSTVKLLPRQACSYPEAPVAGVPRLRQRASHQGRIQVTCVNLRFMLTCAIAMTSRTLLLISRPVCGHLQKSGEGLKLPGIQYPQYLGMLEWPAASRHRLICGGLFKCSPGICG